MKQRKKTAVLIAVITGVLALLAAVGIVLSFMPGDSSGETEDSREDVVLYWNVDRALYEDKDEDGLTSRKPNDGDGYYHILLAGKGNASYRRVKSKILASRMDTMNLMSLVFDEKGLVTDVLSVEEVTGGIAVNCFYVEKVENNVVTTWSSGLLKGVKEEFTITEDTRIYDVSSSTGENAGMETVLQEMDRIIAVQDYDGNITHVWVFQRETSSVKELRYCEHCGEDVEWKRWVDNSKLPTGSSGHFLLMNDVVLDQQQNVTMGQDIILDLNGKTVTGKENTRLYALFEENCVLTILDSSEEQTGTMIATGSRMEQQGSVVWVRYGIFTLYSGTLDASQVTSLQNATCMAVDRNTVVNLFGGTLIGGTSTCSLNAKGNNRGGWGGTVNVLGQVNMYGGTIVGGTVLPRYVKESDSYQRGNGGAVCLDNGAVFNMSGGTITGGKAEMGGGNVYIKETSVMTISGDAVISNGETLSETANGGNIFVKRGGTLNIEGGTVKDGISKNIGGNIYSNGTIQMSGGEIYGGQGKEGNSGANIHMVNAIFQMSGGYVHGLVEVAGNSTENPMTATFSGTARIYSEEQGVSGLRVGEDCPIYVTQLQEDAKISVTAVGTFSHETAAENAKYFTSDEGININHINSCLSTAQLSCLCGSSSHFGACDGRQLEWMPWTKDTTLPTKSGYWFLVHDVALKNAAAIRTEETVYIDLNGKQVVLLANSEGTNRVFHGDPKNSFHLTVTDSSKDKTGTVRAEACTSNAIAGKLIWLRDGNQQVTIYGGTWDASRVTLIGKNGAAMYAANGTSLTIHGGTVLGGSALRGGTVYTEGSFTMTGGTLRGGTAASEKNAEGVYTLGNGGNLCAGGKAKVTVTGGQIADGHADGAGGNLWLGGDVVAELKNVTVTDGTAGNAEKAQNGSGGNVNCTGQLNIGKGTLIQKGTSNGGGGNLNLGRGSVTHMTGGEIRQGTTGDSGGNVSLYGTLNLTGGLITDGIKLNKTTGQPEENPRNANLYINSGSGGVAVLNMSGGTVAGSVLVANGGGNECDVTLSAEAQIIGGKYNLTLPDGYTVKLDGMTGNGKISVSATGAFATNAVETDAAHFAADDDKVISYNPQKNQLQIGLYYPDKVGCYCAGLHEEGCQELTWSAWLRNDQLPTTPGYYYLVEDVTLKDANVIRQDCEIYLDLNGKTVTGVGKDNSEHRVYQSDGKTSFKLVITDTAGGGKIVDSGVEAGSGKMLLIRNSDHFELWGGTLDGSGIVTRTGKNGGCIEASAGTTVQIHGGQIIGGTATRGGAIYTEGTFLMTGGEIRGGIAAAREKADGTGWELGNGGNLCAGGKAEIIITGGQIADGHADGAGGNLWMGDRVTATVENAAFSGGSAGNRDKNMTGAGGNIRLMGTMTMENVTVSGGEALGNSGGIYIDRTGVLTASHSTFEKGVAYGSGGNLSLYGKMTLTGCTVREGVKLSASGNVDPNSKSHNLYVNSASAGIAELTLVDTVIEGGVEISNNAGKESVVTVSGQTRITGSKYNLTLPDDYSIRISEAGLTGNALIGINKAADRAFAIVTQEDGAAQTVHFFASDNGELEVVYTDGKLYLRGKGHTHCVCADALAGHSCSEELFSPWGGTDSEKTSLPSSAGCYYLTADIQLEKAWDWNNKTITLCLNGHIVTGADGKQTVMLGVINNTDLSKNTTLNITDCQGTGVIRSSAMQQGCVLRIRKDPTVTVSIYGGTLDGQTENTTQSGGAVHMDGGKLYLYNGVIDGTDGDTAKDINGGAVNLNNGAQFTMYGGRINGGQDYTRGGAVALSAADSRFYMYGGSIVGGAAKYGNAISAVGQVLIDGGTVDTGGEYTMQVNKGSFVIASGVFMQGLRIMNQDLYTAIPEGSVCTVNGETVTVTESTVRLDGTVVITRAEEN